MIYSTFLILLKDSDLYDAHRKLDFPVEDCQQEEGRWRK